MLLGLNLTILMVAVTSVYEYDTDDITFAMIDAERRPQLLDLTPRIIFTETVFAAEWLKNVRFLKGAVQLKDDIVFLEAILKVLIDCSEEDL